MEQSQQTGAVGGAMSGAATGAAVGSVVPGIGTAIGAVVGGVIGGVAGFLGGGGEKDAKKMARAQAQEIIRAAKENKRVQEMQARYKVSLTKATTYASNIQDTGSTNKYRMAMENEYRRAIDYDYQAEKRRSELAAKGGQIAANTIQRQGWGQVISGATQFGSAYFGGAFDSPAPKPATVTAGGYSNPPSLHPGDY